MRTLALDTSTKYLSIACLENDDVKAEFHEDVGIRHSEILVPTIKDILEGLGWELGDIELICVGLGPGSFTGLRIAVATVKGFAAVLRNKIVGVPSIDVIAMNAPPGKKLVAPFLDARKGKVYSCIYDLSEGKTKKVTEYLLVTVEELLDSLREEVFFFGDAVEKYRKKLEEHPFAQYQEDIDWYPRAVQIGREGYRRSFHATDDPESISPLYLHAKECNISNQ